MAPYIEILGRPIPLISSVLGDTAVLLASGYTMSLISMICGIVSCAMFWMHIGGIFALLSGVAAIILGIMSGKKSLTGKRNGMATTGLICGIIGISLTVIALACWACACSYLASGLGGMY